MTIPEDLIDLRAQLELLKAEQKVMSGQIEGLESQLRAEEAKRLAGDERLAAECKNLGVAVAANSALMERIGDTLQDIRDEQCHQGGILRATAASVDAILKADRD